MAEQENIVIKQVQIEATKRGARLLRNSTGQAWQGTVLDPVMRNGERVAMIINPRRLKYGLAVGSSDLIGWTPVEIASDMIGQTVAVFTAVECKTKAYTKATEAQAHFLQAVADAGGMAYIARQGEKSAMMEKIEPTT
jgi:putative NADH-flavin reductase